MNLIDLYVSEVGKHLPLKSRHDIEAEIRSVLQDMLDERAEAAGRPADDEMVFALLKEYGSPARVAAAYVPERYLIGPRFFPIFKLVLTVVLSVLGAMAVVGMGIAIGQLETPTLPLVLETIGKSLLQFAGGALQAFGNIVLVFAILQRAMPDFNETLEDETDEETWDPHSLLDIVPDDRVASRSAIGEIVGTLIAILIFNFYSKYIGFVFQQDGNWTFVPVLSEAFFRYLPALTVFWGLQILLNIVLLYQGQWQTATRWASIGITLFGIGIGAAMLVGPPLVTITAETLARIPTLDPETAALLAKMAGIGVRVLIGLIIGLESFELAQTIHWMLKKRKVQVTP